jgi:hypothetical protein
MASSPFTAPHRSNSSPSPHSPNHPSPTKSIYRLTIYLQTLHLTSPILRLRAHSDPTPHSNASAFNIDDDPPLTLQSTPTTRVLNTFPLLVRILILLPDVVDVLVCRRVNGTFNDTIDASGLVREKLFLAEARDDGEGGMLVNPVPPRQVSLRVVRRMDDAGDEEEVVEGVLWDCHPRAGWNQRQGNALSHSP